MKKIGLMGCGVVADYGHIHAIRQTEGLHIEAVYDPNWERALALQKKYGIPHAFQDRELFFGADMDAVVITSPAPAHVQNVLDAARHGKDVLCEKPLAMNDAEAETMIAAMHDAGKMLCVGFCYRFSPVALTIKRLIEERAVGDIRALRLIYLWDLHGEYVLDSNGHRVLNTRRVGRMEEGGPMVDCGVHQIDLARWWLGSDVVRHHGHGAWVEDFDAPDHAWLHLDHANGTHTMVEMSFAYGHTVRDPYSLFTYELIGTDGLIRYDRNGWYLESRSSHGTTVLPGADEKNFALMHAEFARALETGHPGNLPTGEDGLRASQIARQSTDALIAAHKGLTETT